MGVTIGDLSPAEAKASEGSTSTAEKLERPLGRLGVGSDSGVQRAHGSKRRRQRLRRAAERHAAGAGGTFPTWFRPEGFRRMDYVRALVQAARWPDDRCGVELSEDQNGRFKLRFEVKDEDLKDVEEGVMPWKDFVGSLPELRLLPVDGEGESHEARISSGEQRPRSAPRPAGEGRRKGPKDVGGLPKLGGEEKKSKVKSSVTLVEVPTDRTVWVNDKPVTQSTLIIKELVEYLAPFCWFRAREQAALLMLSTRAQHWAEDNEVEPSVFAIHGPESVAEAFRLGDAERRALDRLPVSEDAQRALSYLHGHVPDGEYSDGCCDGAKLSLFRWIRTSDAPWVRRFGTRLQAAHLPNKVVKLARR